MKEIITTKHGSCKGCNRCVRECPMETANITYQDEDGSIKVTTDYTKCITCGRCIFACKHDPRNYTDDTELFFRDLQNGIPISLSPWHPTNSCFTGSTIRSMSSRGMTPKGFFRSR